MLRAFILGILEFRHDVTTALEWPEILAYDRGRDLAHRVTLRRFEQA
jgi:hypothetical protein